MFLYFKLREKEQKTVAFPIREYWTDIGQHEDFNRAEGEYIDIFEK